MEGNRSKSNFYRSLGWVIVVLYFALNYQVVTSGVPLIGIVVSLLASNVLLISAWFFVRTLFNKANDPLKHKKYLSSKMTESPIPKYGKGNGSAYVPDVKIRTELFVQIDPKSGEKLVFDVTLKDYLKLGHLITFHDEIDYGSIKRVQVATVAMSERGIEATFLIPDKANAELTEVTN